MTQINKADFVKTYQPYAVEVQKTCGLPVLFVLAQAALESGWGASDVAKNDNNFFGIMPGGVYAKYPTVEAGWQAYAALINTPRYQGVRLVSSQNPRAIAQFLCSRGYNVVNSGYAAQVGAIAAELGPILSPLGS